MRLIKFQGSRVAAPNIKREVVASILFCKRYSSVKQFLPNVFSAHFFINAQVVDIQGFYIVQNRIVRMLLKNTKAISENVFIFIGINQNRAGFILKKLI